MPQTEAVFKFDENAEQVEIAVNGQAIRITNEDGWHFVHWFTDGHCPVCGEPIPSDHVVCRDCLSSAMYAWGVRP